MEIQKPIIKGPIQALKPYISLDPYIKHNSRNLEQEKKVYFNFIKKRTSFLKEELNDLFIKETVYVFQSYTSFFAYFYPKHEKKATLLVQHHPVIHIDAV